MGCCKVLVVGAAYLVCYYGTAGGSGICCNDNTAIEETADNGGSRACGLGERHALGVKGDIAVVVGEVEAAHVCGDGGWYLENVRRGMQRIQLLDKAVSVY